MTNEITLTQKQTLAVAAATDLTKLLKPLQKEIFLLDTWIAGTSCITDESVLDGLRAGDKLILRREPENRFDDRAVLVLDSEKRKTGYIPEKDNAVFANLMDAGKFLTAKVASAAKEGSFYRIRISIYLVDF